MSIQFQSIAVCGRIDGPSDADNEAVFAKAPRALSSRDEALHFAGYRLDPRGYTLKREGASPHLEPLGFALLCYLIEHRDRVVSKRELLDQLWPTRFVTENVVARCVMKVRRALQPDADGPEVIATLHRIGYRFVAALDDQGPRHTLDQALASRPDIGDLQAHLSAGFRP